MVDLSFPRPRCVYLVYLVRVLALVCQVIEEGKHEELLEREGAYSNLMSTQVRSFSTIGD